MKGLSINTMRVGLRYKLVNFGEVYEFQTMQKLDGDNFLLKDIYTLEKYEMNDLVQFGRGMDFEIREL